MLLLPPGGRAPADAGRPPARTFPCCRRSISRPWRLPRARSVGILVYGVALAIGQRRRWKNGVGSVQVSLVVVAELSTSVLHLLRNAGRHSVLLCPLLWRARTATFPMNVDGSTTAVQFAAALRLLAALALQVAIRLRPVIRPPVTRPKVSIHRQLPLQPCYNQDVSLMSVYCYISWKGPKLQ